MLLQPAVPASLASLPCLLCVCVDCVDPPPSIGGPTEREEVFSIQDRVHRSRSLFDSVLAQFASPSTLTAADKESSAANGCEQSSGR